MTKKPEVKFGPPSVAFDIDADGNAEVVAWPDPMDGGWLVRDGDGDGQITSGKDLYGNVRYPGVPDGFDALLKEIQDSGLNTATVSADETPDLYSKLKVWVDADQNGYAAPWELEPLSKYVLKLYLFKGVSGKKDQYGTLYRWKGKAVYADGEERPIYDVIPARLGQ